MKVDGDDRAQRVLSLTSIAPIRSTKRESDQHQESETIQVKKEDYEALVKEIKMLRQALDDLTLKLIRLKVN